MLTQREAQKIQKQVDAEQDDSLVNLFSILSDKGRFIILKLLLQKEELCVTDIARITGSSISGTSHQLRILEMGGLVEKERRGQTICYKIKKAEPLVRTLQRILK